MTPKAGAERREWATVLSREPSSLWPDGIVHHGTRLLILVGMAFLVTSLFPPSPRLTVVRYEEGMVADEDVAAEVPFAVPRSEEQLEVERAAAAAAVPPTFEYRPQAGDRMASNLDGFFSQLDEAAAQGPAAVEVALSGAGIQATLRQVELMADGPIRREIRSAALQATRQIHPSGVVDAAQAGYLITQRFTARAPDGTETSVASTQVISTREFYDQASTLLPGGSGPEVEELLRLVMIRFTEPNYVLDAAETFRDKDQARLSVTTTGPSILAGEVILRRGERVTPEHLIRLQAYEDALRVQGLTEARGGVDRVPFAGGFLLNLIGLTLIGLVLLFYRREVYTDFRWLALHAALIVVYFVVAQRIAASDLSPALLPITFVALTIAVLWDSRQALVLGLLLVALTALQPPFQQASTLAMTMAGCAGAAFSVRAIRRRAQTWAVIAVISLVYALTILALALIARTPAVDALTQLGYAVGNATVSAILAMGFLPVWEWYTRIVTDQTLLEWADPNRPLLKRLSMEAPGTYAHSVNVANLAEAAAHAIGANGLLCRVGAYYHDVGKVLKPQYFIENQPGGRNPHDKLKPATSATIIREHVTEGLKLARDENVPVVIEPFVLEHHGTQRIGFFYQKALEEAEPGEEPDVREFTYPGPRPQSRETAILMIADSVESTTKVLQEPTPERIRTLVENLVAARMEEGQFQEAPITMAELETVKETLITVVTGLYHHRIDYPQTRHLTESGEGEGGADGAPAGAPSEAGSVGLSEAEAGVEADAEAEVEAEARGADWGGTFGSTVEPEPEKPEPDLFGDAPDPRSEGS